MGTDVACLASIDRWAYKNPRNNADTLLELRVTQVFRLEDAEWRLVHRHASPLIKSGLVLIGRKLDRQQLLCRLQGCIVG
jgi:SnoaL-like domain